MTTLAGSLGDVDDAFAVDISAASAGNHTYQFDGPASSGTIVTGDPADVCNFAVMGGDGDDSLQITGEGYFVTVAASAVPGFDVDVKIYADASATTPMSTIYCDDVESIGISGMASVEVTFGTTHTLVSIDDAAPAFYGTSYDALEVSSATSPSLFLWDNDAVSVAATAVTATIDLQSASNNHQNASLSLSSENNVQVDGAVVLTGDFAATATSGSIVMAAASSVDVGSATIALTADEDITLGALTTTNNTNTAVTVTSTAGAILDGNVATVNVQAASGRLVISAATGVGSTNAIETQVDSVSVTNTGSGTIMLGEADALTVVKASQEDASQTGSILITLDGSLTIDDGVAGSTSVVTVAGYGAVQLRAMDAGSSITLADGIVAHGGLITLAADDVAINALVDAGVGEVAIRSYLSGRVIDLGTNTAGRLGLTDAELDRVQARLLHIGDATNTSQIDVTGQITADSHYATLLLESAGNITDGTATEQADITVNTLGLSAKTGIGSGGDLNIAVGNLAAQNADSGNIEISNSVGGLLTITSVGSVVGVGVTGGGSVQITNASPVVINSDVINATGGDIILTSTNDGGDDDHLTINARVIASGGNGNITLDAGTDLILNDSGSTPDISAAGTGTITLLADRDVQVNSDVTIQGADGAVDVTASTGAIAMQPTASIDAGSGTLTLSADGDVSIGRLATSSTAALTSTSGSILESGSDAAADIAAASANLTAGTAIGQSSNKLETEVGTLTAWAKAGGVYITETDGITLASVEADGAGNDVDINNLSGDVLVGQVTAAQMVMIIATAGAIAESGSDAAADITASDVELMAMSGIGAGNALEVSAQTIGADAATNGPVAINSLATTAVTVPHLTTGTGDIIFVQTGGMPLQIMDAITVNGSIAITNTGGDFTAILMTAGGTGRNVTLTTLTSGDVLVGNVTAADDLVTVTAAGAIRESGSDASADITAGTIDLNAVSGIGLGNPLEVTCQMLAADTNDGDIRISSQATVAVTATSLTTGTGDINFVQATFKSLEVQKAITTEGSITINNAGADLTAVEVTAGGTGRNVLLLGRNLLVDKITAEDDMVSLSATGAINELGSDSAADITAGTAGLMAASGIGVGNPIEISAQTIVADATGGSVEINSLATVAVAVPSLTAGGDITFVQTGNMPLQIQDAATSNGSIAITNTGGYLQALMVNAGGADKNVTLTTLTSGNVLVGQVAAVEEEADPVVFDTVTITAAGSILESGSDATSDITAGTIDLNTVSGIGATDAIEVTAKTITADTTDGNIALNSLAMGDVNAQSLTTGTGNIAFTQSRHADLVDPTVTSSLNITKATTGNGAIEIQNTGGYLRAEEVIAGGTGRNVTLKTFASSIPAVNSYTHLNVMVADVKAAGDLVTIASAGEITEIPVDGADDILADITATTINLDAVNGIGRTFQIEVRAETITADTTNGPVSLHSRSTTDVTVGSLTTGTGPIVFKQTGNHDLTVTYAHAGNGLITITNYNGDLEAVEVTADGTGRNVKLETFNSGDVFVGDVTAAGDTVRIYAAEAILELATDAAADITAGVARLVAGTAVGEAANPIETNIGVLFASAQNGGINVHETNAITLRSLEATGDVSVTNDCQVMLVDAKSSIHTPGAVTLTIGAAGSGGSASILGTIDSGSQVVVNGGAGNDTVRLYPSANLPQGLIFQDPNTTDKDVLKLETPAGTDDTFCIKDQGYEGAATGTIRWTEDAVLQPVNHYQNVETLYLKTNGGNDYATFRMSATDATNVVMDARGTNANGAFKVVGTSSDDTIKVGNLATANRFQVAGVAILQLFGGDGNDVISNNTSVQSLIDGGAGDDKLVGGSNTDVILGGAGKDTLYGKAGIDYLFSDYEYAQNGTAGSIVASSPAANEILDGGAGADWLVYQDDILNPSGSDGNDTLVGDGGVFTILDWLKARKLRDPQTAIDVVLANYGNTLLKPFPPCT